MVRALVIALVLAPTLAHAGSWSLEPPTGWRRLAPADEAARLEAIREDDSSVTEVRVWDDEDSSLLLAFGGTADPEWIEDAGSLRAFVARETDGLVETFRTTHKIERRTATRGTRGKPESAVRVLVSRGERLYLSTHAVTDRDGRVRVLTILCSDRLKSDACKRAVASVSFR